MKRVRFTTDDDVAIAIPSVVAHLKAGGLIAYPTETVYGFGGTTGVDALEQLGALKSRDAAKPFLLLIREARDVRGLAWNDDARKLADRFWPGPLTLALPVHDEMPQRILSENDTIAVRATPHEALRALLAALRAPLTSTSANAPGQAPATDADEVEAALQQIGSDDVWILDGGRLARSLPSTVVDCSVSPPRILRAGAITAEALRQIVDGISGDDL